MIHDLLIWLFETGLVLLFGFIVEAITLADENNTARNLAFNLLCTILYFASAVTLGAFVTSRLVLLASRLPFVGIIDLSHLSFHGMAAIGVIFGWFIIHDFFYYWMHRLQHSSKWLWAQHELHHSDEHMNATTARRHHWLETALEALFISFPLIILFRPPMVPAVAVAFMATGFGMFIHLNSRINFGPLNRLISNPSTHRIHHSIAQQHIDKNFAAFFPMWDVMFGTYFAPTADVPQTGLASGKIVRSAWRAFALPFASWLEMLRPQSRSYSLPVSADKIAVAQTAAPLREESEHPLQPVS